MALENRPYIGTWGMNDRTLIRQTPDCLVYINGYLHIPGCRACNGSIDFQKYITSVTVDPSINAVANATISMAIPAHASEAFTADGNYILRTGLFVTVFMRGYFPMAGIAGKGEEGFSSDVAGFDPTKVAVYPYYQVFRGVVTEVSHEYNAGNYTVSMSCSDFLHFWSNLQIATNGALYGPRPDNSNTQVYLKGHRFTAASPYSIIYSLFRVGFGSAGGVEFTMGRKTNIASVSDFSGESLSKMAGLNQERLFNSRNVNLRMYGVDGALYNGFTQAYLGAFGKTEVSDDSLNLRAPPNDRTPMESTTSMKKNSRLFGFNPLSAIAAVGSDSENPATVNVLQMQAFQNNLGEWAQVNEFETEYMTKLEIAQTVCEITGFEFYQDVDGDVVFKPPFYNLDTQDDPVYVIEDRDLISLSESDREPEATYIKGTGSQIGNFQGIGLDGWLGIAGMYADYRLIADFGWREATFECGYLSNQMAIYISCINRLDLTNAGRRSADITIPLRVELRPGYPVYVVSAGAYYYVESLNHSFQFGGQCTTSITGTAKRAKFHAPGNSGGPVTIDNIQLGNPYLPATPLTTPGGEDGPPRYVGFPNVVLALDPDYLNTRTMLNVATSGSWEAVLQAALSYGVIENVGVGGHSAPESEGPWAIRTSNENPGASAQFTAQQIETEWTDVAEALRDDSIPLPNSTLGQIIAEVQRRQPAPDQEDLINYLVLLNDVKARVAPGIGLTGQYRYYSCSHPDPIHQGQKLIHVDQSSNEGDVVSPAPSIDDPVKAMMFSTAVSDGVELVEGTPSKGIQITKLDSETATSVTTVQTSAIRFVTFAHHETTANLTLIKTVAGKGYGYNLQINSNIEAVFRVSLEVAAGNVAPNESIHARFKDKFLEIAGEIGTLANDLKIPPNDEAVSAQSKYTVLSGAHSDPEITLNGSILGRREKSRVAAGGGAEVMTAADFYGLDGDQEAIKKGAGVLASTLYDWTHGTFDIACKALKANRSRSTEGGTYTPSLDATDPLYRARDAFVSAVADGQAMPPAYDGDTQMIKVNWDSSSTVSMVSPVFPVSDREGFEVYGSFPYGRGLNVASYAKLLQTAGPDGTVVGGTGDTTSLTTLIAIEAFLKTLEDTGDPEASFEAAGAAVGGGAAAVQAREDIERAIAAEGLVVSDGVIKTATPPPLDPDSSGSGAKVSGTPIDSQDRGQSTLAANAPQELANIDPGTAEICQCKGAEAMFFMQAFSGEYAQLESNEAVQTFLESEVQNRLVPWELSREAMAGEVYDTEYTSMGERFQKMGSDYAALFSEAGTAFEGVGEDFENPFSSDALSQATEEAFAETSSGQQGED